MKTPPPALLGQALTDVGCGRRPGPPARARPTETCNVSLGVTRNYTVLVGGLVCPSKTKQAIER